MPVDSKGNPRIEPPPGFLNVECGSGTRSGATSSTSIAGESCKSTRSRGSNVETAASESSGQLIREPSGGLGWPSWSRWMRLGNLATGVVAMVSMKKLSCFVGRHRWTTVIEQGESYRTCATCGRTPGSTRQAPDEPSGPRLPQAELRRYMKRRLKALRCLVLSHRWVPHHNDEEPYRECRRCGKRDFVRVPPSRRSRGLRRPRNRWSLTISWRCAARRGIA